MKRNTCRLALVLGLMTAAGAFAATSPEDYADAAVRVPEAGPGGGEYLHKFEVLYFDVFGSLKMGPLHASHVG